MTRQPDNSDPRDYILDLSSTKNPSPQIENQKSKIENTEKQKVSYLSIHFKCCSIYAPIYKNATGTAYSGHCPRCHRRAEIAISPTGSPARIFEAG
jgi:hypothetical protein